MNKKKIARGGVGRLPWINYLRIIAMVCVLIPHLYAYRIDNMSARYLGHYVLNRLHIIQFGGALGVCIFFITSGYLTMPQIGSKRYLYRFIKQIVLMHLQVMAAMLFLCLISECFEELFYAVSTYESSYAIYPFKTWIFSGTLLNNFLYKDSTEAVLWFLIPFLLYKWYILLFDIIVPSFRKKDEFSVTLFLVLAIIGNLIKGKLPFINIFAERTFYICIIMVGHIFALIHNGKINIQKGLVYLLVNGIAMLVGIENTWVGIDDGYIVSAIYATFLFYVFYKIKDLLSYNGFVKFCDKIGTSFFLLHNCVGFNFIQLFYYVICGAVTNEIMLQIILIASILLTMLVITLYAYIVEPQVLKPINKILCSIQKRSLSE